MSEADQMREGAAFRRAARLVSALIQTPDCALELFRDGRELDGEWSLEDLARARSLLDAVHAALVGPALAGAARIERALAALENAAPAPPATAEREAVAARERAAKAAAAAARTPDAPARIPAPARRPQRDDPNETARIDLRRARAAPMPFQRAATEGSPVALQRAQSEAETARPTLPFATLLQAAIDPAEVARAAAATAPPTAPARAPEPLHRAEPTRLPDLSIEECAALFAECAIFPRRAPEVWSRFGVAGEDGYRALEQAWRRRFDDDPPLGDRWRALYEHYCRWFVRAR
jgi:hypothetical protein